jgi:endonuclease YncB( thermonuclease family)
MTRLATATLAMLVVAAAVAQPGGIEVVDGDTVIMAGTTYRLVGFDAPETGDKARCAAERILGGMARARLAALINGGGLELTEVACSCAPGTAGTRWCNYGRACATLKAQGVDVGQTLIAEGLAKPFVCGRYSCPRRQGWC